MSEEFICGAFRAREIEGGGSLLLILFWGGGFYLFFVWIFWGKGREDCLRYLFWV